MQARYTNPGNFVVITPLAGGGMARFARDNNNNSFPWLLRESFAAGHQAAAASVLQSNYGRLGTQEVLSREVGSLKLYHSYFDGDASPPRWKGPYAIGV